ncbi:hypothetical protein Cme02nite_51630 [Catellatospora methionotrophica]|uniref:DUF7824 domain-containing protein n=1 Tax=Catellatospora methionotrophica TaxID=121620 RepID=A0A8J3PGI8_9ACTN|nr:hypothetical protein [Catellatospora methionotrophica]GIG16831.1 hypothetical protein Cme02nite_51630 [Catellatospora methionotrophica]
MRAAGDVEELRRAVDTGDVAAVVGWLRRADEKQRRAAFADVAAIARQQPDDWSAWRRQAQARVVALVGCASTAKKAGVALNRGQMRWTLRETQPGPVLEVLRLREVPWVGELARLMADRLPLDDGWGWSGQWRLVDALVRESGCAVPTGEAFVGGWIDAMRDAPDADDALRASPYTAVLIPMMFTHDGLGPRLDYRYEDDARGFVPALLRLGAGDATVRGQLVEGCRSRLLRGGRPSALRAYTRMHEALAVPGPEAAAAVGDYTRLVESGNSTVAATALRALRGADEAGLLAWDTLRDVAEIALARPEKTLVKAQTTWLRQVARRRPERAAEIAALLADPVPVAADPVPAALPVPVPAPLGPPLGGVAELAEELSALLAGDRSVPTVERVLAAIVHWRAHDAQALALAVRPLLGAEQRWWGELAQQLHGMLGVAAVVDGRSDRRRRLDNLFRADSGVQPKTLRKLRGNGSGLHMVLAARLNEMAVQLSRQPVPLLMATPTHANGRLEAAELLRRLEQAERDGWQPWALDFEQALLRLPREADPQVVSAALRLRSPAGATFARWLSGSVPDPVSLRRQQVATAQPSYYSWHRQPALRRVVALKPPEHAGPLALELMTIARGDQPTLAAGHIEEPQLWTAALPSHREVVAASALPILAANADLDLDGGGLLLAHLAECGGPVGPAVHLALAYGLAARSAADRIAAVDGLLGLAATGDLDAAAVGRELGELAAAGVLKVNRCVSALDEAAQAGAVAVVWQLAVAALVPLVTLDKARPATADLMALAVRCGRACGAGQLPPEVTALAGRGGASRLVSQARELQALGGR